MKNNKKNSDFKKFKDSLSSRSRLILTSIIYSVIFVFIGNILNCFSQIFSMLYITITPLAICFIVFGIIGIVVFLTLFFIGIYFSENNQG